MSPDQPSLLLWTSPESCYVNPNGRATQRICPTADRMVTEYLAAAGTASNPQIVIDLTGCDWVDSTFAGWLLGLRKRLTRRGGSIVVGGCAARCRQSLERMHVAELFSFVAVERPAELRQIPCRTTDRPEPAALKLMLEAHEELLQADASNARTFGPVTDVIRRQIDASSKS